MVIKEVIGGMTLETGELLQFNFSLGEAYSILRENSDGQNRILEPSTEIVFVVVYACLMTTGLAANLIVCGLVLNKPGLRTARNFFVVNLSASDLTLCLLCMPLTLVALLRRNWVLGRFLCRLGPVLQGTNIMVSTGTITAISFERYMTVVRETPSARTNHHYVFQCLAVVWLSSFAISLPLFFFQDVEQVMVGDVLLFEQCMEKWPAESVRGLYTLAIMLVQYVFPIVVLLSVYLRISSFLKGQNTGHPQYMEREMARNRRATLMLLGVTVTFAVSWLPLHLFTVLVDFHSQSNPFLQAKHLYTVFATCHALAMSSAVTNPVLYGWLNTNIHRHWAEVWESSSMGVRRMLYRLYCCGSFPRREILLMRVIYRSPHSQVEVVQTLMQNLPLSRSNTAVDLS